MAESEQPRRGIGYQNDPSNAGPAAPGNPPSLRTRDGDDAGNLERQLSFDSYGRFAALRDIVDGNRAEGQIFTVLDVGGRGNFTRRFLPKDRVFFLDPNVDSTDENFLKGDGCAIPVDDGAFDWVVSTDVFEHIPPESRTKFLEENLRTARLGVILIAPFFSPEVRQAEINANENYRTINGGHDHIWLKEHITNGLPSASELETCLRERGLTFHKTHNNGLRLWQVLMGIAFLVEQFSDDAAERDQAEFNYFYNTKVRPYDHDTPSYRTIYLIEKNPAVRTPAASTDSMGVELYLEVMKKSVDYAAAAVLRAHDRFHADGAATPPGSRMPVASAPKSLLSRLLWLTVSAPPERLLTMAAPYSRHAHTLLIRKQMSRANLGDIIRATRSDGSGSEPHSHAHGGAHPPVSEQALRLAAASQATYSKRSPVAVVLHLYHIDLWREIRGYLKNLSGDFDLFVSLSHTAPPRIMSEISAFAPTARFFIFENRGRDVLPFLKIFKIIEPLGYQRVCKIHGKKSLQLVTGDLWRNSLIFPLLGSKNIVRNIRDKLSADRQCGMLIPPIAHVLYRDHIGVTEAIVKSKFAELHIGFHRRFVFPAGSMFWFKPEALKPLLSLDLHDEDFLPENGQVDGTMAHVIERLFCVVVEKSGYNVQVIMW